MDGSVIFTMIENMYCTPLASDIDKPTFEIKDRKNPPYNEETLKIEAQGAASLRQQRGIMNAPTPSRREPLASYGARSCMIWLQSVRVVVSAVLQKESLKTPGWLTMQRREKRKRSKKGKDAWMSSDRRPCKEGRFEKLSCCLCLKCCPMASAIRWIDVSSPENHLDLSVTR